MTKVKMIGAILLMLGLLLGSLLTVHGARDLNNDNDNNKRTTQEKTAGGEEVVHPQNIYGGVGGVGGVVPGEGGVGQPIVVSGGTSFYCPFPGFAACSISVHPSLPGGAGGGGLGNP